MCGPLCDAVLDTAGSAEVLVSLAGSNLLLLPLDRQWQWYRYHHLFRGLLRAELDRREPELVAQLHARAALWCEANGLAETAIDHAQAAGDADRVARLVAGLARATYAAGRVDTARSWVGWFDEQGLIDRMAMERHDWPQAATLAEQALAIVRAGQLDDYINSALVSAVAARTALHRGDVQRAHERLARAARLRPLLTYAIPWVAVQALLELARAYLAVDDLAGARVVLREANDILRRRPDLGTLPQQAAQLGSKASGIPGRIGGASSLTKAELRLLPLLPTQLTYQEIGERLYLSQHTVKKQAVSIHRKLGVSSRSQAVECARRLGLGV